MKPEQSQNASMVSNRKKLRLANISWCQASVITVKRQMKAAAGTSASQRPGFLRVHKEQYYRVSAKVLMAVITPQMHRLIKQLLLSLTFWSTFYLVRDGETVFFNNLTLLALKGEQQKKKESPELKIPYVFKASFLEESSARVKP